VLPGRVPVLDVGRRFGEHGDQSRARAGHLVGDEPVECRIGGGAIDGEADAVAAADADVELVEPEPVALVGGVVAAVDRDECAARFRLVGHRAAP
jgi:hypothetical protein